MSVLWTVLTRQLPVPEIGPDEVLVEIKKTVRIFLRCRHEADL